MGRYVEWTRLLPLLGLEPPVQVLPCVVQCPLCPGSMTVYLDYNTGGQWFHCSGCGKHGDLIELAAMYWQLSVHASVRKLHAMGAMHIKGELQDRDIEDYIKVHVNRRLVFREHRQTSQQRLTHDNSKTLRSLQHKLGLRLDLDRERWLAGPGQFVGGVTVDEIEKWFNPLTKKIGYANSAVFRSSGWGDVLVIPFWDMPERVKGFLIMGRNLLPANGDIFYRGITYHNTFVATPRTILGKSTVYERDAGIAMRPAVNARRASLGNAVFVLPDPVLALKMHAWHFQDHSDTLPLVASWCDNRAWTAPTCWNNLSNGPLVFWGPPAKQYETFKNARCAGGRIARQAWPKNVHETFSRKGLHEVLKELWASSVPWQDALAEELRQLPTTAGEEIIHRMAFTLEDYERFFAEVAPDLRTRFDLRQHVRVPTRIITMDGIEFSETSEGWLNGRTQERVCDATFQVERAIYSGRNDEIYYSGTAHYAGKTVPFCDHASDVEDNTRDWLRKLLMKGGVGYPTINAQWSKKLFVLATKFHKPVACKGYDVLGWNEEAARFIFPGFAITASGDVVDEVNIWHGEHESIPAASAPRPGGFAGMDADALGGSSRQNHLLSQNTGKPPEEVVLSGEDALPVGITGRQSRDEDSLAGGDPLTNLFWAMTAVVVHNILCPVYNLPPCGVALVGEKGARTGMELARLLGCVDRPLHKHDDHAWPPLVDGAAKQHTRLLRWLQNGVAKNAIVSLPWYTAKALAINGGWSLIGIENYIGTTRPLLLAAPKVIPEILQFVTAEKHFELGTIEHFGTVIERLLAEWFVRQGGNAQAVTNGVRLVDWPASEEARNARTVRHFYELLAQLQVDGIMPLVLYERRWQERHSNPIVDMSATTDGGVFITKTALLKALASKSAPGVDDTMIYKALVADGSLLQDTMLDGRPGWQIHHESWKSWMERTRRTSNTALHVTE